MIVDISKIELICINVNTNLIVNYNYIYIPTIHPHTIDDGVLKFRKLCQHNKLWGDFWINFYPRYKVKELGKNKKTKIHLDRKKSKRLHEWMKYVLRTRYEKRKDVLEQI